MFACLPHGLFDLKDRSLSLSLNINNYGSGTHPLVDSSVRLADEGPGGCGKLLQLLVLGQYISAEICAMHHVMVDYYCQEGCPGAPRTDGSGQESQFLG